MHLVHRSSISGAAVCWVVAALLPGALPAATLTTTNVQTTGQDWTGAIWKTNTTSSTFFSPVAGNSYACIYNGTAFGNSKNNTRIRNPALAGVQTFPGDSLTLNTNTELRMKQPAAILNFPGVGANPGLILNGGVLNPGDDGVFVVTGRVQVAGQSYLCPGNGGGGNVMPLRGVNLAGQLSGSGTLVIMQSSNVVAQQISGNSNTFSGRWIVKAGWLLGSGRGSLGTNSITLDPNYVLPLDSSVVNVKGPAVLEPAYDLNSAGTLILTNAAVMKLHQNCAFRAVTIEGTALASGTHYYAELIANFPNNFAGDGSGSITVQPYGPLPGFAPAFLSQPFSATLEVGSATQLVASVSGALPLGYQWQKGTDGAFVILNDGGDVSGARSNILTFSSLLFSDSADYRLVATNSLGAATSQVATVTVVLSLRPTVTAVLPAAGTTVGALTQIAVTFSTNVIGVNAQDLQINGLPADSVSGGGSNYLFTFSQPAPGSVVVTWDPDSVITDLAGHVFDTAIGWAYTLGDIVPPDISVATPAPGAVVSHLDQVQVFFSEQVTGVEAADLRINGAPAASVSGTGFGPYVFQFVEPAPGSVALSWAPGHLIRDLAGNLFPGTGWSVALAPPAAARALTNIVINEFLAANVNTNGLRDEDLELSDWIEIYNRGDADVNLAGWSLTDQPNQPARWTFPATNLTAGGYLLVFASGKDRRVPGANLHTSFALGSAGDYLGLYNGELPPRAAHEYAPQFPEQRNDISYGLDAAGQAVYLAAQTPGYANSSGVFTGAVAAVHFSVSRGWFEEPFNLLLTTLTPGAVIRYTTDGSPPTEIDGQLYTGPILINHTTTLRAAAFSSDLLPSLVQTHTYIFLDDTLNQPADPAGFPVSTLWSTYGWLSEYAMDPVVVTDPLYAATIRDDVMSLPALSVVMRTDDMFGDAYGLYTHASDLTLEAPCSVELINPDGSTGFQCDAGIRMHGGGSRQRTLKHPFRLVFKGQYGAAKLKFRFFPDSPVTEFDKIDLRSDYNNHWTHGWDAAQRARGGLVRDAFFKDLHAATGSLSSHSRYVHLYINGLYWGVYNPCERPDADFAASYLGGEKTSYDAYNGTGRQLVDGDSVAHDAMLALNTTNLSSLAQYEQISQYLDVPQYIDYLIGQLYGANWDWGTDKNWYAVRLRQPGAGFKYLCWDSERTLEGVNENRLSISPDNLQANLVRNAEYRLAFADRVNKHFFNGGAFTTNAIAALWLARAAQLDRAIVLESARWGNMMTTTGQPGTASIAPAPYPSYTVGAPYTREANWLGEQGRLLTNYFPARSAVVLSQFTQAGLYPSVAAPAFNQPGGRVASGFDLTMTAPAGSIYFTTDGSDPRIYGLGSLSPSARLYADALTLTNDLVVKARVLSAGTWSALTEAAFSVNRMGVPIRITELMYNPIGGDAYEFIELQNVGATPVDLSGFSLEGVTYVFPNGTTLAAGATMVLASAVNPAAFALRYPGVVVAGTYGGELANGGERIAVLDANGNTVVSVDYKDSGGWPTAADGSGYSLEILDPNGDPDDPANWRASAALNGSPGLANPPPAAPSVRINEVMADNAGAVTNGGTWPDWVELYNTGTNSVSLANWSFSNSGNARKYVFPGTASLPGRGYLVLWCDTDTNAPGLHSGFALGRKGESLFLYDPATNQVDAFSFGLQVSNYTVGRAGLDAAWQLTLPTPGTNNVAASVGGATNLVLNEWLANAAPGDSDWVEVFNKSPNLPVSLSGIYLATSNDLFQVRTLSFVGPRGFAQLFADRNPGAEHLDFKLSAAGDALALYDRTGQLLDAVAWPATVEGVSRGRLPDGSANFVDFPGSPSPGASNYVRGYTGPILNELMARNGSIVYDPWGHNPDWLELYNPARTNYSLAGMSLGRDPGKPGQWLFPPNASISSNGFLVVWCDSSRAASTNASGPLNAGFDLNGDGDAVYLFDASGRIADSVAFGPQVTDMSIGRRAGVWALLASPTPGVTNAPNAILGSPASLKINEWLASPGGLNDWFELYNTDALSVALDGLWLTDDPSVRGRTNSQVAALTFVAGHGWVKFEADAHPSAGPNHVNFGLDRMGETLRLYSADLAMIDDVDFGFQAAGVSQGRLPDGGDTIVDFPSSPSPAASNYLPLQNVLVNEVLSHTDPPLEDAIELYNPGATNVPVGGWFISNSDTDFKKYRIPNGTSLPARGYRVFYEYQFNGTNATPFTLNSAHGDNVLVSEADAAGNLTGRRAQVSFPAAGNGVSFGRFVTSVGEDFAPLARRTFGVDNPSTVSQFRTGTGLTNAGPRVGPVVVNEIMFHPVTLSGTNLSENPDEEFVELFNISSTNVPLYDPAVPTNTWKLAKAVDFTFPGGVSLAPGGFLLVVGFDPVANPASLANFRLKYGLAPGVTPYGPWQGRLNNAGERLELIKPDSPQAAPHPDAGFVPYLLVEQATYSPLAPWPLGADGGGLSLQRRGLGSYANDPLNWAACSPTPGMRNCFNDTDGDGLPDDWELANGLNPLSGLGNDGPNGDPDADGFNNLQEYLAGTNPRDPQSCLKFDAISQLGGVATLRFTRVAGHSYTIQFRNSLATGSWQKLADVEPSPVTSTVQVTDPAAGPTSRFYRLVTPSLP